MVLPLPSAVAGVLVTLGLAIAAVWSGAFTRGAGVVAAVFASVIVVLIGWPFFGLLVLFVVASVFATRYRFEEKRRRKVHEGTRGERGVSNVLAHALVPAGLAVGAAVWPALLPEPALAVVYTSALAFGSADTFASEFGVLAGRARSILTGRRVVPGTNGGVSAIGEVWAFVGALTTGVVALAWLLATHAALPPSGLLVGGATAAGFLGCQVDSVLGETLENRGYLTKGSTNLLGMISSAGMGALFLVAVGGVL